MSALSQESRERLLRLISQVTAAQAGGPPGQTHQYAVTVLEAIVQDEVARRLADAERAAP